MLKSLRMLRLLIADNGLRWTGAYLLYVISKRKSVRLSRFLRKLEEKSNLPGEHSAGMNYFIWQTYDWSAQGEEWTPSEGWKQTLIDEVLLKHVLPGKTVLEIGPGAGRWSVILQSFAKKLILVDISDRCIELCRQRLAAYDNVEYHVNDGSNLSFLPSKSIDYVWSFDVFVHIEPRETASYLSEIKRVLVPGGRALVHHPVSGGMHGGWRSSTTQEQFNRMLAEHGLRVLAQFDSWGETNAHGVRKYHDAISVIEPFTG